MDVIVSPQHLMLDTLGWVLGGSLVGTGQLHLARQHYSATVKLYSQVNKDTADHIITAFRSGTFYQIRDICRYCTLRCSALNRATTDIQKRHRKTS